MARAANAASATITETNVLTGKCRQLWVRCDSTSVVSLNVRVQNNQPDHIHADSEHVVLAAGEEMVFNGTLDNAIAKLTLFTSSGIATYSFSVLGN